MRYLGHCECDKVRSRTSLKSSNSSASVSAATTASATTLIIVQTSLLLAVMEGYEDESFEEDEGHTLSSVVRGNWKEISFEEVELGEQLGGGSVGLVHRGAYAGKAVALKTLVGFR